MKLSDIHKLHDAGFITAEQQDAIIAHFHLREETNRFLAVISTVGALLVAAGIILLVARNWDLIPRLVKVVLGIALMLGAHAGGYWLREGGSGHHKTGDALHLIGSLLFLGNIALLGQIYHMAGRPPDAILLWLIGIVALPWLLRSRAQHVLVLLGFGLWVVLAVNEDTSWLYTDDEQWQLLLYALLGLIYYGAGYLFYGTSLEFFSGWTQKLGLLAFHICSFPMTWKYFYDWRSGDEYSPLYLVMFGVMALLVLAGSQREHRLPQQWRVTWGLSIIGAAAILLAGYLVVPEYDGYSGDSFYFNGFVSIALFIFCLIQVHVGTVIQSPFYLNLGVTFIAIHIITTYINLFGSMGNTGLVFVIGGVFLLAFGVYLEKKRRALMQKMRAQTTIELAP